MTQQAIGALSFSLIVVSFFALLGGDIGLSTTSNVAQTMNGTGAFVGSSAPANVSGTGGFGSSPANPAPSTNTPAPASNADKKPPEASTAKCTDGQKCSSDKADTVTPKGKCTQNDPKAKAACEANKKKAEAQIAECREDAKNPAKECKENEIKSAEYDDAQCVVTLANGKKVKCQDEEKIKNGCPTVSSTNGKSCNADSKEPGCECKGSGSGSGPSTPEQKAKAGELLEQLQKKELSGQELTEQEQAMRQDAINQLYGDPAKEARYRELSMKENLTPAEQAEWRQLRAELGPQQPGVGPQVGLGDARDLPQSQFPEGASAFNQPPSQGGGSGNGPRTEVSSNPPHVVQSPVVSGEFASASGNAPGSIESPPTSYGSSNPVRPPSSNYNPAGAPNTNASGINTNSGNNNYGPFSGNYNSLQQYQPYANNSNPIAQFSQGLAQYNAQQLQQQQAQYGASQTNPNVVYTAPSAPAQYQQGVTGAIGNFIRSVVGVTGVQAPSPEGVVYYGREPIAYYRTEDGAIVIDRARIPRQTPEGVAADPADLVRALVAQDVSVAAQIRSQVSSGQVTLAVPSNPDDQNQSFANIENLIVQDEVTDALRVAEEAALTAKDSIPCEIDEAAEQCLARRIAAAQEIERRVFVDELNRRPLSQNAVAHFIGLYDGVADPAYTSTITNTPSILSQLNQSGGILNSMSRAVGAAVSSVSRFVSWMLGA